MTTKKKLFSFIICISFVLSIGLVFFGGVAAASQNRNVYAASTVATVSAEATETTPVENEDGGEVVPQPDEKEETHTFLSRVWEFVENNYPEIAATVGNVIVLILLIVNNVKSKKELLKIDSGVLKQTQTQSDIVDVVNGLIQGYNTLEEKLSKYNDTEDERYAAVGAMVAQTKAILEILTTVYANSKNIPQGVKDLVNLKYANVLKTVEDEDKLKEVVIDVEKPAEETQESKTEV